MFSKFTCVSLKRWISVAALLCASGCGNSELKPRGEGEGAWASEVTPTSVILSARVTTSDGSEGARGYGRFEIFEPTELVTDWVQATEAGDYIARARLSGLSANTSYRYRFVFGPTTAHTRAGNARTFTTLAPPDEDAPVRLAAFNCLDHPLFLQSAQGQGPDGKLGYPGLVAIRELEPQLVVLAGDVVYYDEVSPAATTQPAMRELWHVLRRQPRMIDLLGSVASFWMKDDHDYRFDDSDPFMEGDPSAQLGRSVWYEQAALGPPEDAEPLPYRTRRLGSLAQIWLLEGREFRDANAAPDDENKSLWGVKQRDWLEASLLASDAPFRIVITPTPLLGPDDLSKSDNHVDVGGFQTEGRAFLEWAEGEGLPQAGLLLVTGDRHWQYHSIHPTGVEELSMGTLVDANARIGVSPGDPNGTDPDGLIEQPFTSPRPTGGFLWLRVDKEGKEAVLRAELRDGSGEIQYAIERRR